MKRLALAFAALSLIVAPVASATWIDGPGQGSVYCVRTVSGGLLCCSAITNQCWYA